MGLAFFGLAYNLHRFPANEILKGKYGVAVKKLAQTKERIDWGPAPDTLPVMTMDEVRAACEKSKGGQLIVLGIVHDVAEFAPTHPGGKIINAYIGKDATEEFTHKIYNHSNAARNLLHTMRVARLPDADVSPEDEAEAVTQYLETHVEKGPGYGPLAHRETGRPLGKVVPTPYVVEFGRNE